MMLNILFVKTSILSLGFFLFGLMLKSQVIQPAQFIEQRFPSFSPEAITSRSITNLTVKIASKPSNRPIQDKGERLVYFFNEQGRTTELYHIFPRLSGKVDTTVYVFDYSGGELVSKTEIIGKYQRRVSLEDYNDKVVKRTIEVKREPEDWHVIGIEKVEKSEDKTNHILMEQVGQFNSTPYQHTSTMFDTKNRCLSRETWNGSRLQSSERWAYDGEHLTAYSFKNAGQGDSLSVTYQWLKGQPESGTWCEGQTCLRWSMVYHPDGLPKGWIFIEPKSENLKVWEFAYTYRTN